MLTPPRAAPPSLTPSVDLAAELTVEVATEVPSVPVTGVGVAAGRDLPAGLDRGWTALEAAGFTGSPGQTIVLPAADDTVRVLVGVGPPESVTADEVRDAAAQVARRSEQHAEVAVVLPDLPGLGADEAARAAVEGLLLARYRYDVLKANPTATPLTRVVIVVDEGRVEAATAGVRVGQATARATQLARDLANAPPSLLTAVAMAEVAERLGPERGLQVDAVGEDELVELGCGGLLGVNAGSTNPPRMIRLRYAPDGEPAESHVALVGKGIMYDSGGLALKPGDPTHANMKNDMSGAAAILAAMLELRELECRTAVSGWLMCTDNMPSGTATAMGDVLRIHGGTTVEVANTDAEGRLVMADALVMAVEEGVDAIVDVATLTGAAMRALGTQVAGVMGNHQPLVDQVTAAGATSGESVWQLPLEHRYRSELDSEVADLKNLGGPNAGAITAALFLAEFVGDVPWAHLDIAGVAQNERDTSWRPPGNTGFGARLLLDLLGGFAPVGD